MNPSGSLTLGLGESHPARLRRSANASQVLGVCEQERITSVRAATLMRPAVPDEAVGALPTQVGAARHDMERRAGTEPTNDESWPCVILDHHHTHA